MKTYRNPIPTTSATNAVIWDFDGTLVDSREKNRLVTRSIIETITGKSADRFPALASLPHYETALADTANWRELYRLELGLSESDIDRAGQLWADYQLNDDSPIPVFQGIPEVLSQLQHLPHGIVSQNGKQNISVVLEANNLSSYFRTIIGYEEVDFHLQKPAPEGFLRCLETLTQLKPGHVFYIGDHETDARCAQAVREALPGRNIEIVSIGARYGTASETLNAGSFDHVAHRPADIVHIIQRELAPIPQLKGIRRTRAPML